jgi:hypothetical protein
VELTTEKRILLALMMGLSEEYWSLVQIWSITLLITVEKAIEMVYEEATYIRPTHDQDTTMTTHSRGHSHVECWHYKRKGHKEENCWEKHPEKRPSHQCVVHPEKPSEGTEAAKVAGPPTSEKAW